jgi:oligoribonuclease NrnB/cAMP/cGMP phosphodiesterase (DHH superfamily)
MLVFNILISYAYAFNRLSINVSIPRILWDTLPLPPKAYKKIDLNYYYNVYIYKMTTILLNNEFDEAKVHDIVIYHQGCPDGITALWCANTYYKVNDIQFEKQSCPAGKKPLGNFENKKILFVDLCPSLDFIIDVSTIASKITILDHHKSAFDMYLSNLDFLNTLKNVEIVLKMEFSGCQLAWDYFYPTLERPWFIEYVADRDLWKWALPNSKEISNAFYHCAFINENKLELLDDLYKFSEEQISDLVNKGKTIGEVQNKILNTQLKQSFEGVFIAGETKYNVQFGSINRDMRSDLGNLLTEKVLLDGNLPDFSIIWNYDPTSNGWYMSMRGSNTSPDLSIIAKHFNGGGHAKASGFETSYNPFGTIFIINTSPYDDKK